MRNLFMLRSTRNRFLLATTVAVLIVSPACHSKRASDRKDYFPETGQVEGWNKSSATRTFPADRLYEYIDGDADRYLKAGVEHALTSDYRYRAKIDAVADIFVMKDAAGAAGVLESQPANGSQSVQIGDAARLYPGTLMLRQGRFFVRVVAYDEGPDVPGALLLLGRAIADRVK
jgi:hypothetical protein